MKMLFDTYHMNFLFPLFREHKQPISPRNNLVFVSKEFMRNKYLFRLQVLPQFRQNYEMLGSPTTHGL